MIGANVEFFLVLAVVAAVAVVAVVAGIVAGFRLGWTQGWTDGYGEARRDAAVREAWDRASWSPAFEWDGAA